ncbi:MAG: hypothetical protein WED87_09390 [Dehalococcoidia bacterium]
MHPPLTARSIHAVEIRLNDERWLHITEEHAELAGLRLEVLETIERPERVLAGNGGELLSVRTIGPGKALVVVYREEDEDGFVITAFVTRRLAALARRRQTWPA